MEVEYVGKGAGLATRCGRRHCQDVLRTTGKLPDSHRETAGAQVAVEFLAGPRRDFGKRDGAAEMALDVPYCLGDGAP